MGEEKQKARSISRAGLLTGKLSGLGFRRGLCAIEFGYGFVKNHSGFDASRNKLIQILFGMGGKVPKEEMFR